MTLDNHQVHCWCGDVDVWVGESWMRHHYEVDARGDDLKRILEWVLFNAEGNWGWEAFGGVRDRTNPMFYFELESDYVAFILGWA